MYKLATAVMLILAFTPTLADGVDLERTAKILNVHFERVVEYANKKDSSIQQVRSECGRALPVFQSFLMELRIMTDEEKMAYVKGLGEVRAHVFQSNVNSAINLPKICAAAY